MKAENCKLQILLSKKTTKRGGGGQKSPILRRHSLWTAPYSNFWTFEIASLPIVPGHYSRKFGIPVIKKNVSLDFFASK